MYPGSGGGGSDAGKPEVRETRRGTVIPSPRRTRFLGRVEREACGSRGGGSKNDKSPSLFFSSFRLSLSINFSFLLSPFLCSLSPFIFPFLCSLSISLLSVSLSLSVPQTLSVSAFLVSRFVPSRQPHLFFADSPSESDSGVWINWVASKQIRGPLFDAPNPPAPNNITICHECRKEESSILPMAHSKHTSLRIGPNSDERQNSSVGVFLNEITNYSPVGQ